MFSFDPVESWLTCYFCNFVIKCPPDPTTFPIHPTSHLKGILATSRSHHRLAPAQLQPDSNSSEIPL